MQDFFVYPAWDTKNGWPFGHPFSRKIGFLRNPVIHAGFKPATPTSVVWYSIQLS